jgi:hypothetical protein
LPTGCVVMRVTRELQVVPVESPSPKRKIYSTPAVLATLVLWMSVRVVRARRLSTAARVEVVVAALAWSQSCCGSSSSCRRIGTEGAWPRQGARPRRPGPIGYCTVARLLLDTLRSVARSGRSFVVAGRRFVILHMARCRIRRVAIRPE